MSFLDNVRDFFDNIFHHQDHTSVTVTSGQTLEGIVRRASPGATNAEILKHEEEVMALNPGMDPDMIYPGDVIKLPRSWG